MTTSINQKAYLQKYIGGSSGDKKKKKKKVAKGKGFKIIDDDIDLTKLRPLDSDELDIFDDGEDAPQIAGIIDDRPEELKQLERLKTSSKWKVVNQNDGINSKLEIEEIKKDLKEAEKENELIFGKMYSDSEDEKKNNSDHSPPRNAKDNQKASKPSKKHNSDSDFSPPRKREEKNKNDDSDVSPPRPNKSKERMRKPSRWGEKEDVSEYRQSSTDHKQAERSDSPHRKSKQEQRKRSDDSDVSPPRKSKKYHSDDSPPKRSKKNYDSDKSPPRKSKRHSSDRSPSKKSKKYDSDESPPRKSKKNYDSDQSPPRKSNKDNRQNRSPSRKSKADDKRRNRSPERISPSKRRKQSPPRQNNQRNDRQNNHRTENRKQRHSSDSDISPPRKNKRNQLPVKKSRYDNDSDQSPPRRDRGRDMSDRDRNKRANDSPPPSNKKMAKTLEGKMAGLQDARQLRQENDEFRKREEEVFSKMTDEVSGRNAKVVSRKGKRETSEERRKLKEKAERQKEIDEKYKKWSRGLKQIQDQEARVQEFMHEASKPLARHQGDKDLETNLKQIEREGDPMLKYIKEKKRERGELGPEKPLYKGNFPPNRFNIRPGYRWDGVDRSNGYEKKYFEQQSKKKAQEEEAYKWSTEDL